MSEKTFDQLARELVVAIELRDWVGLDELPEFQALKDALEKQASKKTCPICDGYQQVKSKLDDNWINCPRCKGTGTI